MLGSYSLNSAVISVKHMANAAMLLQLWYTTLILRILICVCPCVSMCIMKHVNIDGVRHLCCVLCFLCALWPAVIRSKAAGGHATAPLSCLCWLVRLLFVVYLVVPLLVQIMLWPGMPECLPACSLIKAWVPVWNVCTLMFARMNYQLTELIKRGKTLGWC